MSRTPSYNNVKNNSYKGNDVAVELAVGGSTKNSIKYKKINNWRTRLKTPKFIDILAQDEMCSLQI